MTPTEIRQLSPEELTRLVAELVMGWHQESVLGNLEYWMCWCDGGKVIVNVDRFKPLDDPRDNHRMAARMAELGWIRVERNMPTVTDVVYMRPSGVLKEPMPCTDRLRADAEAAVLSVMEEKEKK